MQNDITLSRGPDIDTEKCVSYTGNRFNLVLVASARAREIRNQHYSSLQREHVHTVLTALDDIQNGKVDTVEYLRKAAKRT